MRIENAKLNAPLDVLEEARKTLAARLRQRHAEICEEISCYPPPIPACDAQFNYLLEARRGIARELARLRKLSAAAPSKADIVEVLDRIIEESPYLDGDARRQLRLLLTLPR